MRCPGQDTRYWDSSAVSEAECPECGHPVEFFKDESTRTCRRCGHKFANPQMDFGCAAYCKFAERCIGNLPPELVAQRDALLKERVALKMKPSFSQDFKTRVGKGVRVKRKIIEIDEERCDGCGQCVPACAEGAIQIIDGKARLVSDKYCDGLGACLGECPQGALRIIEREAAEFDETAVEQHLQATAPSEGEAMACGCPSAQVQLLTSQASSKETSRSVLPHRANSELSHWPVQIRLIPTTAPFLKGADLLVAADCTPVACPRFHQDFLKDKIVMVGCAKFDDAQLYEQRFAEIFAANDIKSVTAVVMEVPCCQSLPIVIQNAMEKADKQIALEKVVVSLQGEVLRREAARLREMEGVR